MFDKLDDDSEEPVKPLLDQSSLSLPPIDAKFNREMTADLNSKDNKEVTGSFDAPGGDEKEEEKVDQKVQIQQVNSNQIVPIGAIPSSDNDHIELSHSDSRAYTVEMLNAAGKSS